MKKYLLLSVISVAGIIVSASAAETWKEAFEAGRAASRERKWAEAEKNFIEAEKLAEDENSKANAIINRVDVLRSMQKQQDALKVAQTLDFTKITSPSIKNNAMLRLARSYREVRNYTESEKVLRELLRQESNYVFDNAWNDLGATLFALKRYEEAEQAYREIEKMEKFNYNVFLNAKLNLGRALNAQKKYDQANQVCQEVLADPKARPAHFVDAYTVLGDGARYRGEADKVREYYGKAIAMPECSPGRKANLQRMIDNLKK